MFLHLFHNPLSVQYRDPRALTSRPFGVEIRIGPGGAGGIHHDLRLGRGGLTMMALESTQR